jgi:hypothetical protein
VAFAVCALLTACTVSNPFRPASTGPPLPVLVQDVVRDYEHAPSVQVRGSYQWGSIAVTVQLRMQPGANGDVTGGGTYRGFPLQVVGDRGQTYTKGVAYWQAEGANGLRTWPAYGEGWVLAPSHDPGATALLGCRNLGGLLTTLSRNANAVRSSGTEMVAGRQVAELHAASTTYEVSTSAPYRLLALRRSGSARTPGGLTHVDLAIGYGPALAVHLPTAGQFVDPGNASTFPALYEVQSTSDLQSCDASSCGFTATLLNTAGPEQGQVVATLSLYQDAQFSQLIGSCQVAVPSVATGQTTTVTCRITDDSYQSFYAGLGSATTVYRHVTLQNPPYD